MTTREQNRARLAALDDDGLYSECLGLVRAEIRRLRPSAASNAYLDAWYACMDRGRVDLFESATNVAVAERKAQDAANVRRANELRGYRKP